ncbi:hypothetical protein PROFUN_01382 [Planoprotostelium fungivorum]|uniref:PAS domain-containing protein n=1 Tax=Planoprotostelium fungivorum TaxID=1890364 RepID=A0A2P6NT65_9EUKA|nr:hypothetical protein PROFUN_01382 [Planoprotostelium fungivorum]
MAFLLPTVIEEILNESQLVNIEPLPMENPTSRSNQHVATADITDPSYLNLLYGLTTDPSSQSDASHPPVDESHLKDPYKVVPDLREKVRRRIESGIERGSMSCDSTISTSFMMNYEEKKNRVLRFVTEEQKEKMKEDFTIELEKCVRHSNETDTPSIIWLQYGAIHHVNQAYKDLTGFSHPLPSTDEDHLYDEMFHHSKDFDHTKMLRERVLNGEKFVMYPGQLRIWKNLQKLPVTLKKGPDNVSEAYIECVMSVTIKRDLLLLPVVYYATLLPSPSVLKQMYPL